MTARRIETTPVRPFANRNVAPQYAIQKAGWITHPDANTRHDQFHDFELAFELAADATFVIHVSGDQRFELFCDGVYIGMGPDRSDLEHWSFHSYQVSLSQGPHRLSASLHAIVTHRAHAQVSRQPAFILAAEQAPVELDTGTAAWRVCERKGVACATPAFAGKWYQVVGPNFTIDGEAYFAPPEWVAPRRIEETNVQGGRVGFMREGWRLYPSRLPEQMRARIAGVGRIRMVAPGRPETVTESPAADVRDWQALVSGQQALRLEAETTRTVLWDLEDYHCGYPAITTRGGAGASISLEWAEACFEDEACRIKGDRNRVDGKYFEGYGDTFIPRGGAADTFRPFWWRAGRFLRLVVTTAGEPLVIEALGIDESRLPLEAEGRFASDDDALNAIVPLAVRGIQMCAHETYMDCPYYEQMMYVGDTRLQLLTACVISPEHRLHQRAMEMLDWSRHVADFVLMRHPSDPRQLSTTFSMVWIMMIRDLAWWQRDPCFIRQLLPGMRAQLEVFRALADERMLFTRLPGWSFLDWAKADGWDFGCPPEAEFGTSGLCNLLFLLTLQSAIDIEETCGERHFAASYREWSAKLAESVRDVFWDADSGAFADDADHRRFSEHAQCLAILSGMFDAQTSTRCLEALLTRDDLARTTVYFSFYLCETLYRMGRGDLLVEKMNFWKALVAQGFKAPVEQPEPSRSDCHAWGSHPLFHMHASLCGIRPASAGFRTVRIAPQPGALNHLACRTPHPDGFIEFEMTRADQAWKVAVALPRGVSGVFDFQGTRIPVEGAYRMTIGS